MNDNLVIILTAFIVWIALNVTFQIGKHKGVEATTDKFNQLIRLHNKRIDEKERFERRKEKGFQDDDV